MSNARRCPLSPRPLAAALLPLAACAPTVKLDLARSDAISTVFTADLTFDGALPDAAWMEFTGPEGEPTRAPVDLSGDQPHRATLLGMRPVTDYEVRTVLSWGGEEEISREQTVTTGQIPAELPDLVLDARSAGQGDDFLVTSVLVMPPAALILDRQGEIVWWYLAGDVSGVARATLTRARDAVLFSDVNLEHDTDVYLHRVSLDGAEETRVPIPGAHHDFVELPDGSVAFLATDPREVDGQVVPGDALRELRSDGSVVEVWNAWDSPGTIAFDPGDLLPDADWPHANALDYLEDEDAFLVSFLAWDAILRIDRATGTVAWVLGHADGDFTLPDGDPVTLEHTHQMELDGDNLLVFINGEQPGGTSRVVELALDEETMVATPVWEHWPEPEIHCLTLGDVHRYPSGNTLITWSFAGRIDEVSPEGEILWSLSATLGGALGYTRAMPTLYPE